MTKFDWPSCAVGVIAGAGAVLCVVFATQLEIFVNTPICESDENGLTCARNWVNAFAVLAAAGTIFFLARDQIFNRELAVLQSLGVRAQVAAVRRISRSLRSQADHMRQFGFRLERGDLIQPGNIRFFIRMLLDTERFLRSDQWTSVTDYDVRMTDERLEILALISDLVRTFLGDNEQYVRLHPAQLTGALVQTDWMENIGAMELIRLSYRTDRLCSDVEDICRHLVGFRAVSYFRSRDGDV